MTSTISISAERRTGTGKGVARKLRLAGRVPAVLYGHGRSTDALSLSAFDLERALIGHGVGSTLVDLTIDGSTVKTLIREIQRHPLRAAIMHVDFFEIHAGEKIKVEVPVHLVGSPEGVRNAGGVLDQIMRTIQIEVLPERIPEYFEVDVTHLNIGKSLHVRDIPIADATVLSDPDATLCTVVPPRLEEAPPVAAPAEEIAEPELIRKPRAEGEEAEGEGEAEKAEE
ncbi:MAG: 50S ribosomal protein L25 [Gemmatimonadetes bacterium]|jgi:large subunit ribosomal protein L25|nr:50S ribosomal protein L25 [Gemmatimonadota bacterium]